MRRDKIESEIMEIMNTNVTDEDVNTSFDKLVFHAQFYRTVYLPMIPSGNENERPLLAHIVIEFFGSELSEAYIEIQDDKGCWERSFLSSKNEEAMWRYVNYFLNNEEHYLCN